MHPARSNKVTARIVDEAIALLERTTRRDAARYMEKHGVTFRVIVRLLAPGEPRRTEPHMH